MNILQTPTFKRKFKKLSPTQKQSVKDNVLKISKDPSIGVMKKGDLSDVRVHKFKILGQEYLLAYFVHNKESVINFV
jgi:mRNA-degrading endonuclease RelE of RelBE toxin-antitoxin system